MSIWLIAEIGLLLAVIPCAYVILRGSALNESLLAVQAGGTMAVLALVVLAPAIVRPEFYQVAVVSSVLAFAAGFMLAYVLMCWFR